ncbi:MAG: hypothetical protein PUE49_00015 [Eggerthellales bacterium]|nr:hypothetical protein [Eggerthellales bacterium]
MNDAAVPLDASSPADLFEDVRAIVGCDYISDLRMEPYATAARRALPVLWKTGCYSRDSLEELMAYVGGEKGASSRLNHPGTMAYFNGGDVIQMDRCCFCKRLPDLSNSRSCLFSGSEHQIEGICLEFSEADSPEEQLAQAIAARGGS